MINHFLSPEINANNRQNQRMQYFHFSQRNNNFKNKPEYWGLSHTWGVYNSNAQSVWKWLQETGVLKRIITLQTIVTKRIVLEINPDVAVTEKRCREDHSLEGKYKLLFTQILKPFWLNELKIWCLQCFRSYSAIMSLLHFNYPIKYLFTTTD